MRVSRDFRAYGLGGAAAALLLVAAAAFGGQPRAPLAGVGAPSGDPGCGQPNHIDVTATVNYGNGIVSVDPDPVPVPPCTIAKITWVPGSNASGVAGVRGCKPNWPLKEGNPAPSGHVMLVDSNISQASHGPWAYTVSVTDKQGKSHPSAACDADPPPVIHNG